MGFAFCISLAECARCNTPSVVQETLVPSTADERGGIHRMARGMSKVTLTTSNTGPIDQSNMTMIVGRCARVIKRDEKK